jgi:hypothetical protein
MIKPKSANSIEELRVSDTVEFLKEKWEAAHPTRNDNERGFFMKVRELSNLRPNPTFRGIYLTQPSSTKQRLLGTLSNWMNPRYFKKTLDFQQ